jgi:hypothetical protein
VGCAKETIVFKVLAIVKRRPGMTMEEFIAHYESTHSKISEPYLRGNAVKYIRRYLRPMPHPLTGEVNESEYDAIMELWFEDRDHWNSAKAAFAAPGVVDLVNEDEKRLFDRDRTCMFTIEELDERVSELTGG